MTVNSATTFIDPIPGRVALGIPLYGAIHTLNVIHMLNHLAHGIATRTYGTMSLVEGAYVDHARNTIVRNCLETAVQEDSQDVTHLFFMDQDVLVDEVTVQALLALDLPVVGAVYFGRDEEHLPIAFDVEPFKRLHDFDPDGLNKVGGIGMGATLINLDVFREMQAHFKDDWWYRCSESNEGEGRRTGEDIWFAHRCAELGIPIMLDGRLRCGHVGAVPITYRHFLEAKERKDEQSHDRVVVGRDDQDRPRAVS